LPKLKTLANEAKLGNKKGKHPASCFIFAVKSWLSLGSLYDMALGEEQANVRETPTAAVYDHLAFTINSDQEAFNTRA